MEKQENTAETSDTEQTGDVDGDLTDAGTDPDKDVCNEEVGKTEENTTGEDTNLDNKDNTSFEEEFADISINVTVGNESNFDLDTTGMIYIFETKKFKCSIGKLNFILRPLPTVV